MNAGVIIFKAQQPVPTFGTQVYRGIVNLDWFLSIYKDIHAQTADRLFFSFWSVM